MTLGTAKGMQMHEMDVNTAFLHAPLEEEVDREQSDSASSKRKQSNEVAKMSLRTQVVPPTVEYIH